MYIEGYVIERFLYVLALFYNEHFCEHVFP